MILELKGTSETVAAAIEAANTIISEQNTALKALKDTLSQKAAGGGSVNPTATAKAVNEAAAAQLPIMLEPFMSNWVNNKVVNDLSPDAVIQSIGIAAGLGNDSSYTWMKLPVVEEMERVMEATTIPTLLLGGDNGGDPDATYTSWKNALSLPGVRVLTVGRTLLYPHDDDVAAAVDIAANMVHPSLVPSA